MKVLIIRGNFTIGAHFKSPFAYQVNTTMPVPFPSTLLGALARRYLPENNDYTRQYTFGEYFLGKVGKGKKKTPITPTILLRDDILAAYVSLKSETGEIPIANIIQTHYMAQGTTDVRGKEFLFRHMVKIRRSRSED